MHTFLIEMKLFESYYILFTLILYEVSKELAIARHVDLLEDLDYKNEEYYTEKRFLRVSSPKKSKSLKLFKLFQNENVNSFTLECIVRLKIWSRQQFVLFHLVSNKNRIWIYIENGNVAVEFKIDDKSSIGYFKNPWVYDQQWHKIFLSYSKGDLELYFDGNRQGYNGPKFPQIINFSKSNQLALSIMFLGKPEEVNNDFDDVDIKTMILHTGLQRPYEENCADIPNAEMFRKTRGPIGPRGPPGVECVCP